MVIIPVSLKNEQVAATVNGEKILVGDVAKFSTNGPTRSPLAKSKKKTCARKP